MREAETKNKEVAPPTRLRDTSSDYTEMSEAKIMSKRGPPPICRPIN